MKIYEDSCLKEFDALKYAIFAEHDRQLVKWGIQKGTIFEWLTYLGEEVGELRRAASEIEYRFGARQDVWNEAIQVATLALKIAGMVGSSEARIE